MPATYAFHVPARDTGGLDPKVFAVHIGVYRRDGGALTPAQLEAIQEALAPLAAEPAPTAKARPAKAKAGTAPRKASAKAKAKGPAKAPSKPARKASKTTARNAARRPAGG